MEHESTVCVVDEDAAAREAVLALVRSRGLRAAGFPSAGAFLAQYSPTMKGCIVVAIGGANLAGLELLQKLKSPPGSPPVVAVAASADISLAVRVMREGALTFLQKAGHDGHLWNAIAQALAVEQTQYAHRCRLAAAHDRLTSLAEEELEVFRRMLAGHANRQIATDLHIGLRTVELRRSNILKKMQATSLPDLARLAILTGFFPAEG